VPSAAQARVRRECLDKLGKPAVRLHVQHVAGRRDHLQPHVRQRGEQRLQRRAEARRRTFAAEQQHRRLDARELGITRPVRDQSRRVRADLGPLRLRTLLVHTRHPLVRRLAEHGAQEQLRRGGPTLLRRTPVVLVQELDGGGREVIGRRDRRLDQDRACGGLAPDQLERDHRAEARTDDERPSVEQPRRVLRVLLDRGVDAAVVRDQREAVSQRG
jgi:hypothetical protein